MNDISAGGIAIETNMELEKEAHLRVEMELESGKFNCEGIIKVKLERQFTIYGIAFLQEYLKQTPSIVDQRDKIKLVNIEIAT